MPLALAGSGEVAEVREENRSGMRAGGLPQQLGEDRIGGRVRPCTAVAGHHERERIADRRLADALRHEQVPRGALHATAG
jgi:hypothetical protein